MFFYSAVFFLAGILFLSYAIYFARRGEMPIKRTVYYRHRNPLAFWFFTFFFCCFGLAALVLAAVLPFLKH